MIVTPEGQYKQAEFSLQSGLYDSTHHPFSCRLLFQKPILENFSSFPGLLVPLCRLKIQNYLLHTLALVQAPTTTLYRNITHSTPKLNSVNTKLLRNVSQVF